MTKLEWAPLTAADLPSLCHLAEDCLDADGGLPQLASTDMLTSLFLSDIGIAGRDETGDIVAAAALFYDQGIRRTATGLVAPGMRSQGVGEELIAWCRDNAQGNPLRVRIENVSIAVETLFAEAGLRRVFAETVMRHRLRQIPHIRRPNGIELMPYTEQTAGLFYEAYRLSFAERPGFPDTPKDEWIDWLSGEADFVPEQSRVAVDADGQPSGFITVATDWIDQVGVVPAWRGRRLGAHLVTYSLASLKRSGSPDVWLCVSDDNPSRILYERLGFKARGTRARYERRAA